MTLSNPTKVGDGMGSYMVYKVTTKVLLNHFVFILFGLVEEILFSIDELSSVQEQRIQCKSSFQRFFEFV